MTEDVEHAGTLVIRVWVEDDEAGGVRARITRTVGLRPREEVVTTASSVEQISDDVRTWLDTFLSPTGMRRDPPGTGS